MKPISPSTSAYSEAQLRQYLSVVEYRYEEDGLDASTQPLPPPTLQTLRQLNHLHLTTFPFDSSAMQYTDDHTMNITTESIYQRMVVNRLGGSYCFGMNTLLLEMLKGLGFLAFGGGGNFEPRLYPIQDLTDCGHMVILVQIPVDTTLESKNTSSESEEPETWLVDVGYGGTGLVRPLLLSDDEKNVVIGSTSTELHRLRRIDAPKGTDASTQWWRFEKQHSQSTWDSTYIFSESPFHPSQYQQASDFICTVPSAARFWWSIVAVKYFPLSPDQDFDSNPRLSNEEVALQHPGYEDIQYGRYTLNGDVVKKTVGTQSEVVRLLVTEGERIEVLREMFGVVWQGRAEENVRGRDAAIGSGFVVPLFLWQKEAELGVSAQK